MRTEAGCVSCNGEGWHYTPSMLPGMPDHRLPCTRCKTTGIDPTFQHGLERLGLDIDLDALGEIID